MRMCSVVFFWFLKLFPCPLLTVVSSCDHPNSTTNSDFNTLKSTVRVIRNDLTSASRRAFSISLIYVHFLCISLREKKIFFFQHLKLRYMTFLIWADISESSQSIFNQHFLIQCSVTDLIWTMPKPKDSTCISRFVRQATL